MVLSTMAIDSTLTSPPAKATQKAAMQTVEEPVTEAKAETKTTETKVGETKATTPPKGDVETQLANGPVRLSFLRWWATRRLPNAPAATAGRRA
jgi:hypothetical protein